ncbi:MAG: LLM class F420-dependent oxidoreductase [Thermomicrobiales bacterium]|nr:MAG: LLM class F420-dependent oxidoreductase [Thermomicrobiales bacterium]
MMTVQFGFCVPIFASPGRNLFRTPGYETLDPRLTMDLACQAESLGYDSLWVADHLMLGKDDAILEGCTVLSALAGATSRAKLGMIHQALLFRHPALAAKMAATLDQISGGRLIHFLDCGYLRREYVNYGLPWEDDVATRVAMLTEATELILALWQTNGPVTFTGTYYHVQDAVCAPKPAQQPHPPVWFGEVTPGVPEACARFGQGWNTTPVSLTELRRRLAIVRDACERAGRSLADLELSLETQILIAPDLSALRERLQELVALARAADASMPEEIRPYIHDYVSDPELTAFLSGATDRVPSRMAEDWIIGTPDAVEQRLRDYLGEGIRHVMLWFMDIPRTGGMELFAHEVAPRLRASS